MDHPRSKLPAVLAVLFCIALLGGVGVLLWKTLPEKQQPQQAETIQTDSVFSSEQTAVEPEREAPYEGELPEQAEAAQPEQPDSEQPSEPAADPAAPDDTPVTDAQKTAQATLASMTEDEKLWQLFFVTPEAITNVNTATVAGEATKNALAQYPVVYMFAVKTGVTPELIAKHGGDTVAATKEAVHSAMNAGPGLMFITLPKVFATLGTAGTWIGLAFFVLVTYAAAHHTSGDNHLALFVLVLEVVLYILREGVGWKSRTWAPSRGEFP